MDGTGSHPNSQREEVEESVTAMGEQTLGIEEHPFQPMSFASRETEAQRRKETCPW